MYLRQTALDTKKYIRQVALCTKRYLGQVALFPSGMLILVCIILLCYALPEFGS